MKRLAFIMTVSALAAACASTPYVPPPPPPPADTTVGFRAEDFAWSAKPGTAQIKGTVAAVGYNCAGGKVVLTPDTPFSRRRIKNLYGAIDHAMAPVSVVRSRQTTKAGGDYSAFVRTADCGADNRFSFRDLPAGGWFAIVAVEPTGEHGEPMALLRRVELKKGEIRSVTLQ